MHSEASLPFVLPRYLAHDIDTLEDWQLAELFYGLLSEKQMLNGL
jgi:pseudaminic acid cytidylyltransferase